MTILLVLALATTVAAWGQTPGKSAWPANIPDADQPAVAFITGGQYHQDAGVLAAVLLNTAGHAVNATAQMGLASLDQALKSGNPIQVTGFVSGISSGSTISFSDKAKVVSAVVWFRWDHNWVIYARIGCGNPVLVWEPVAKPGPDLTDPCEGRKGPEGLLVNVTPASFQLGDQVVLSVSSTNFVGGATFRWSGAVNSTASSVGLTLAQPGTHIVTVQVTDDCGTSTAQLPLMVTDVAQLPASDYGDDDQPVWGPPTPRVTYEVPVIRSFVGTEEILAAPYPVTGWIPFWFEVNLGFGPQQQVCWVPPGCNTTGWDGPTVTQVTNIINNTIVIDEGGIGPDPQPPFTPADPDDSVDFVAADPDAHTQGLRRLTSAEAQMIRSRRSEGGIGRETARPGQQAQRQPTTTTPTRPTTTTTTPTTRATPEVVAAPRNFSERSARDYYGGARRSATPTTRPTTTTTSGQQRDWYGNNGQTARPGQQTQRQPTTTTRPTTTTTPNRQSGRRQMATPSPRGGTHTQSGARATTPRRRGGN